MLTAENQREHLSYEVPWRTRLARAGVVAALYFLSAGVGLAFVIQPEGLAAVWPPAGVALAALLLTRPREWPWLLAGIFAANGAANLLSGNSVAVSLGFAVANCAESLLAAAVLVRFLGLPVTLARLRDVVTFTLLAAVGSNAVTSLLGAAVPALAFGASYWDVWRIWWVADGMGMLVVGSAILTWAAAWSHERPAWSAIRVAEAVGLLITMGVVAQMVFEIGLEGGQMSLPLYTSFPVLIWGAIRFGPAGASACAFLLTAFAVWHTAHGHGFMAYGAGSAREALLQVQEYVAIAALTALTLAAVVGERRRAETEATLRRREAEGLARAAASVAESLDLPVVAQRIVDTILQLLGCYTAVLRTLDPDGSTVVLASAGAGRDSFPPGQRQAPGIGTAGPAIAERRTVWTRDQLNDARLTLDQELRERVAVAGERAVLSVPLEARAKVLGVLVVAYREARDFSEAEVQILEGFAGHAAAAIENARLYAESVDSAEQYRGLVEGSIQGIDLHQDGIIRVVNHALLQMLGYADAEELVGQPYWTVLPPHERARVESYRTARLRGELAPAQYEVQVLRKDGSLLWVDILVSVVRWRSAPAILTTWIDITERKRAEEARARAEEQLREAQRMEAIGHLTGGVAHHFNNLLTVIIGRLDMAREALGATRPEISARLEKASDAARRGAELVRRLLAFARRQPLAPKMLDLNRVLADMSELLRRTVGESIEFEIRPGAGLWEVEVDPGQVELSLFHLALNAREAMPTGGTLRIETANVTLRDDGPPDLTAGEYVMIAVTDTGSGMSPETLERAFDPFFTTKEIGQGSGLGLSMVHGFARQSGGTAKIESALGAGTTVRIYLPRATPRVTAERGALAAPAAPARREETVLVLEDEAGVRQTVVALLTGLGYRVLEAASGGEALTIIRGPDPVDLLLSDIVLPGGLSGPEVGRQARSLRPGLRILYTSGYFASADEIVEKLDAPLLPKPYPHAELGRRIREILDSDPT